MAQNLPPADIIIPTRGRGAMITLTIDSILNSDHADFNLWIIDQSDDRATGDAVLPYVDTDTRVHYVHLDRVGSSLARHEGVSYAESAYLIFTDDDCRVETDWLRHILIELSKPQVSAVFGRILDDDTYEQTQDDIIPVTDGLKMAIKEHEEIRVYADNRFDLGFGHGANMAVTRACYEQVGGFDIMLGAGGKFRSWPERDIGYRILQQGGRITYTPHALVYHRQWRGWKKVRRTYRNYAYGTGAAVAKYIRCGDMGGIYLLAEWMWGQGVRQVASGILKWRSWQKIQVGLLQIFYPWVGIWDSRNHPIDRTHKLYKPTQGTD